MTEPICPKCQSKNVEYEDCYDASLEYCEETETDELHRHIEGFCMDCGEQLQWTEIYNFNRIINMKASD